MIGRQRPPTQHTGWPLSGRHFTAACGSCHDDRSAQAHIQSNSADGLEACEICHGEGKELSVEVMHKNFVR